LFEFKVMTAGASELVAAAKESDSGKKRLARQ
jgi:hypothetical protein